MPATEEFVAHNRSVDEVAEAIGADWLVYQDLDDLIDAVSHYNSKVKEFDCSCFDGKYITNDVDSDYFIKLQAKRNDASKNMSDSDQSTEPEEI